MQTQIKSNAARPADAMSETMEVILSALAGCGLVLMLAFFLSLESWLLGLGG